MGSRAYLPLPACLAATLAAAGAAAPGTPAHPAAVPAAAERHLDFAVLLDGKPIGTHEFTVAGPAGETRVHSHARFRVTVLRVPFYQYEHEARESWHAGCLVQLEARTEDNGHNSQVHGELRGDSFQVEGPAGATTLPGCVKTFAYWDRTFLSEQRLLNAQTGEYEAVQVRGPESASIGPGAHARPAEHYILSSAKLHIELWYSAGGDWLALESRTDQGRLLRYELH